MKKILYTRLIRPKNRGMHSRNKNIQDKLNRIVENKLTVVKGGPAVGKSTLISDYVGEKNNYMWLSLDENSDNLSYFWTYILHGLKNNIQDVDFYIDMINPLVNREDIFELISSIINELINKEELFIVLDDFQYIEDDFIIETVEYFIANSSDNIHFILISRYDIGLYLGNILMKGGVVEINSKDFNLTFEETKEFIKNTTKDSISNELIDEIYFITEGWVGAIKLMLTASLKVSKNIKGIPRSSKLFIEYMNKEIISSLSQEEIDFLVKTSPLNYVNPSIYNDLSTEDGFKIIENLIEKNMLIITIDEEKKIFRYHNILRQHLIELFDKYDEKIKDEIINKLTTYLLRDENYDEAISVFVNWNKYEDALKIIEKNAQNIIATKILNEFPMEFYKKSIDLAFITIFYNYLNLDYEKCSLISDSLTYLLEDKDDDNILNSIKIFKIALDNSSSDYCYLELPLEIRADLNILTKTIYYIMASWTISFFFGECKKALEMQERIKKSNKELNNSYVDLLYKYSRVSLLEDMGRLKESEEGYKKLNSFAENKTYKSCFSIFKTVGLPGIYIKKLMYKEAEELLLEAEELMKEVSGENAYNSLKYGILYNLAEVKYIKGDIESCEELLSHIEEENKESYFYVEMLALKIRLLSTEDKIKNEEYNEFSTIYEKNHKNSKNIRNIELTYGLVLFEIGRYEESLTVFDEIVFGCRKNGMGYLLVYSLLWKAILLNKLCIDNTRELVNVLKEAIFYSRDEDILFPYYKNRKYLKPIIQKFNKILLEDEENINFVKKLNKLIGIKDENEALSPREIEVLNLLIDGLSNKEIGERLFISVSTVKTHIINIYSKLGVKNRVEAVNEGRRIL